MPNIIFNAQFVATEFFKGNIPAKMKQIETGNMYDYYDRDEACDKSYYDEDKEGIEIIDTKQAFDYYGYRIGSTGSFNHTGILKRKDVDEETQRYKPEIMYRCVFSFDDDFATKNNLKLKENMQSLIKKTMNKNIKTMGFQPDNINWGAYYHTNTKNPHVHVWFYEKERSKKRYIIPKEEFKKVKSNVIRLMELNTDLYIDRDAKKSRIFERLEDMGFSAEMKKMLYQSDNNHKNTFQVNKTFIDKLKKLEGELPKQGSMKFNSKNIKPFHKEILSIVDDIKSNTSLRLFMEDYQNQLDKEIEAQVLMYGGDINDTDKQQFKENKLFQIDTQIANLLLGTIKEYRKDKEKYEVELEDGRTCKAKTRSNLKTRSKNLHHAFVQEMHKGIDESFYATKRMQIEADKVRQKAQEEIRNQGRSI